MLSNRSGRARSRSPLSMPQPSTELSTNVKVGLEETGDWNAVLRLVSDQARAIKGIVGASGEVEARVQRIEAWQMELIANGGAVSQGTSWSNAEIDAADGWQMALSGLNERMQRVGNAFGQYVQTNAARVETLTTRLASVEQMAQQVSTVAHALASHEAHAASTTARMELRFDALERGLAATRGGTVLPHSATASAPEEGVPGLSGSDYRVSTLEQTISQLDHRTQSLEAWRAADQEAHSMVNQVEHRLSRAREQLSVRLTELEIAVHAKAEADAGASAVEQLTEATVEVVCPPGSTAGEKVQMQIPDVCAEDETVSVEIPKGVQPGEAFEVTVSSLGAEEPVEPSLGNLSGAATGHLAEWRESHEARFLTLEQQLEQILSELHALQHKSQSAAEPEPEPEPEPELEDAETQAWMERIQELEERTHSAEERLSAVEDSTSDAAAAVGEHAETLPKALERLEVTLKENVESARASSTQEIKNLETEVLNKLQDAADASAAELSRLDTRLKLVTDQTSDLDVAAALEQLEIGFDAKILAQTTAIEQSTAAADEKLRAHTEAFETRVGEVAAALEQLATGFDAKILAQTTAIEQSTAAADEKLSAHVNNIDQLIGTATATTSREASQLEDKLVARIKAASEATVIKCNELEEEMWEHMAKIESESRASDREHDQRIAQSDASRQTSERALNEQLQALTHRLDETQALIDSKAIVAQQRADSLEKQLQNELDAQHIKLDEAKAQMAHDSTTLGTRIDETSTKIATEATTAEMRSRELRELVQSCAETIDDLTRQQTALEGRVEGRIDKLSSSIDEHHHVFSETCEMLDQKTAMLDRKCALKLASAPPEKIAVLSSQMDQIRNSLAGTSSGTDSPRGADVWRSATESVLSRTRSVSSGGGSIRNDSMFLDDGTGLPNPDGSPTARVPDHAVYQRIEKMEARMNTFEETAWDEKHEMESRLDSLENTVAQLQFRHTGSAASPRKNYQQLELTVEPEPEQPEPEPEPQDHDVSAEPDASEAGEETEVITLEIACPEDGSPGDIVSVQIDENDGVDIEIPDGVKPGDSFEVHIER